VTTRIEFSGQFKKSLKRLGRKYPKVLSEVNGLISRLEADEREGDKLQNLGNLEVYKARLKNPDAKSGKSGGFRVIYYVKIQDMVYLLEIYSKSEQENISSETILEILEGLNPPDEDEE
jgi:mRNA-degrading endonuclease RelE of RelBE toxin-antitoxin system